MKQGQVLIDANELDPSFETWFTNNPERIERFQRFFPDATLLAISGYLDLVVKYWITLELAEEYIEENPKWYNNDAKNIVKSQQNDNSKKKARSLLPDKMFEKKLLVSSAAVLWSKKQWHHQVERLFLASDSSYDLLTMEILQSDDGQTMTEAYYRAVDDNESFGEIGTHFSQVKFESFSPCLATHSSFNNVLFIVLCNVPPNCLIL